MPLMKIGSICPISMQERIIGSELCLNCMFHNDTYQETKTEIFCVFPSEEEIIGDLDLKLDIIE